MKFCRICQSLLQISTSGNAIIFACRCGEVINGNESDTLVFENRYDAKTANEVYSDQSIFLSSRMLVEEECDKCGVPYKTMIITGSAMKASYRCECESLSDINDIDRINETPGDELAINKPKERKGIETPEAVQKIGPPPSGMLTRPVSDQKGKNRKR